MKKVLFLDDSPRRHRLFLERRDDLHCRVIGVFTAAEAIERLQSETFDEVHLDRDLSDAHMASQRASDVGTGEDVVKWIVENRERLLTTDFIVHSWSYRAPHMVRALRRAQLRVAAAPFDERENVTT